MNAIEVDGVLITMGNNLDCIGSYFAKPVEGAAKRMITAFPFDFRI